MQTFLPYPDFKQSAKSLDRPRLGKQRVEAYQLLQVSIKKLITPSNSKIGWSRHPAYLMWAGYEYQLCNYGIAMCEEWISRGYKDTLLPKFQEIQNRFKHQTHAMPPFVGNNAYHLSHKQALLHKELDRKEPAWYSKQWIDITPKLEYVWSIK